MRMDDSTAAAVVGFATFELWRSWNQTAPSLSEMRAAEPDSIELRQRLLDAGLSVGTLVLFIGLAMLFLTGNPLVLVLLTGMFAILAIWHNAVLTADAR